MVSQSFTIMPIYEPSSPPQNWTKAPTPLLYKIRVVKLEQANTKKILNPAPQEQPFSP